MVVQHNLQAMNANRMLGLTTNVVAGSTEKLSSGYRINRAADDAAGLAISEKMRKQVRGLTQAAANAEDGISCVQTAEGALAEVQDMIQRMNELCVQAANGTNSSTDRQYIQDELDQLVSEIDRIAETTKFNETFLLKGDQEGATTTVYITNYSVTYTENLLTQSQKDAMAPDKPTEYRMNYIGTNNVYVVDAEIIDKGPDVSLGATKLTTGSDMTEFMIDDDTAPNKGNAAFDKDKYVAFINCELDSDVKKGDDLTVDGSTSIVKAKQDLYIYNTANGTITHLDIGTEMTKYLNDDNTIKEQYRLVDTIDGPKGTSKRVMDDVTNNKAFEWNNDYVEIDTSLQKLYNVDGQEVSGIALNNYFDENGNYKGGLYKSANASATDMVFASTSAKGYAGITGAVTIGKYITQSSQQIAEGLTFNLHVGAQSDRKNKITATIDTLTAAGLGVDKLASYNIGIVDETGENATDAIDVVDNALIQISRQRSALGAVQNRLDHTVKNLDNIVENTTAAESAIRDTDMAEEMVKNANASILQQAGQSMLAQANQSNQGVLTLLQG
ncbi:MAG: flagellar hook protein [Lachnospiraceae bacterium]|nr:flagellar hook protein [Lachnospiraceae bacterium]